MSEDGPELLEVRIPGLRGVTVPVQVDRAVWAFFDGLEGSMRKMPEGTPLQIFRRHLESAARNSFARGLEQGRTPAEAVEVAATLVGTYMVPIAFVHRVLETGRQLGARVHGEGTAMLAEYLGRRPVQFAAVLDGLGRDHFPQELRPAVRRVIAAVEAHRHRN